MATDHQKELCQRAFNQWGTEAQLVIGMEECGELLVAISHHLRDRPGSDVALAEEIADVELVCTSLRLLVGDDAVDQFKRRKWDRLQSRLEADGGWRMETDGG